MELVKDLHVIAIKDISGEIVQFKFVLRIAMEMVSIKFTKGICQ